MALTDTRIRTLKPAKGRRTAWLPMVMACTPHQGRHPHMAVPPRGIWSALDHHAGQLSAERRQALEAWSAWLADFVGKRPADVVPLRQVSPQAA